MTQLKLGEIPVGKRNKKFFIKLDLAQFSNLLLAPTEERLQILRWLEQLVLPALKYPEFGKVSFDIHYKPVNLTEKVVKN